MVLIKIEISFGKHIVQSVEKYGVLQSSKSDIVHGKIWLCNPGTWKTA